MDKNKKLKPNGFSLTEAVVATVSVAMLAVGSAAILSDGAKIANYTDFQSVLNQVHNYNVQKVRQMQNLRAAMNSANVTTAEPCYVGQQNTDRPCNHNSIARTGNLPELFENENETRQENAATMVRSTLNYRIECTATKCSRLLLTVTTAPNNLAEQKNYSAATRSSEVVIPLTYLLGKQQLDFQCSQPNPGSPVFSIDFATLRTSCNNPTLPAAATTCSGDLPLKSFDGTTATCQVAAANTGCNESGIKQGTLLVGASTTLCNTGYR